MVQKLGHGIICALFLKDDVSYQCTFNENTKDVDEVLITNYYDKSIEKLLISDEELKATAVNFIKENKLDNMENVQYKMIKEVESDTPDSEKKIDTWNIYCSDSTDSNKNVMISIDAYTGRVIGFAVNDYADYIYDRVMEDINSKTK